MQDEEFIQSFIEESKLHIETVETELLNIDITDVNMESINTIFRAVHTIKGTSGFFDFKTIVKLSHALENLYGEIRSGQLMMTSNMIDVLLNANDCLKVLIDDVMNSEQVDISDYVDLITKMLEQQKSTVFGQQLNQSEPKSTVVGTTNVPVLKDSVTLQDTGESDLAISPDGVFYLDNYLLQESKRKLIRDEVKRGCFLYLLRRSMYSEIVNNQLNLIELIEEIKSMGNVIDMRIDQQVSTDNGTLSDLTVEILFTTVLEKDFLPPILNEPEDMTIELTFYHDDEKPNTDSHTIEVAEPVESVYHTMQVAEPVGSVQDTAWEKEKSVSQDDSTVKDNNVEQDGSAGKENDVAHERSALSSMSKIPVETTVQTPASIELQKQRPTAIVTEDSVRVSVTLLNNLLNLSSEMVLARNQLFRRMEDQRKKVAGIDVIFQNINHITTNLQETIMQTRMQPVSNVFSKFPRIARELSKKLEKDLVLELEGTEVELDKSIIEALGDPLTHLVRNAIDHGMEMPDVRVESGKARTGKIKLKAYHESGYVNIDVIDDGKGIDTAIIRKKALEKGFIQESDLDSLGEQKSLQLLFKPGFSTAEAVTDLSGRGVGMDVVKTNIEKLGGKIEIFTNLGKGTTFRLLLPLTLAIIPSLIVEAERQKFALPQINVQEIVRIKANDPGRKIEVINQAEVLRLRGRLLPIVRLSDVLGLQRTFYDTKTNQYKPDKRERIFHLSRKAELLEQNVEQTDANDSLNERRGYKLTNIVRIIVIKIGSRRMGLSVDTIFGSEEILVKTLPTHISGCNNYSGVTILGDGKVAMILDPSGIIENANLRYIDNQPDVKSKTMITEAERMRELQSLLLFKCSGPELLALDMAMVFRVEEVYGSDISQIGEKEYMKFRGEAMRVIRPEHYLPIQKQTEALEADRKYFVIIPKLVKYPMGILMEKVHDTVQAGISLTGNDSIRSKGLVGSTILNEKIILLINIYELFEMANPEQYKIEKPKQITKQHRILLVEDTPFFQKLEKDYLENAGYDVTVADNGKIALQILQTETFDMIVSDINMPEIDGLELIRRIRADAKLASLPVVAVTSLTGENQRREGLAAGFDAYEFKLDRSRLLDVLEETMSQKR